MKIVKDETSPIPRWKYRGYTVAIRAADVHGPTSLDLRKQISYLKTDDEIVQFVVEQIQKQTKLIQSKPGYYSAIATRLHFRCDEFFGDHRDFVLCNYADIVNHLFAPALALPHQNIVPLPGAGVIGFQSVLTRIRSNIASLHPARRDVRKLIPDPSLVWVPFVTEIFKGLEYLSKLYFLKNHQRQARKTFVDFVGLCSELSPDLRDVVWEFRCGVVHHGTLYNHTARGVFRFGVQTLGPMEPAIKRDDKSPLFFVDGEKYVVNLRGLSELMESAQRFVFDDMTRNVPKYVLSHDFYVWIGRSWNLQYIPSKDEMRKFQENSTTAYPMVDLKDPKTSRRMSEVVVVEYEDYVWKKFVASRFPRGYAALVRLFRRPRKEWIPIFKSPR